MKYADFEYIISSKRMERYLQSCHGNSRKAMTLYRYNLHLSQNVFTVISCFEVALRNAINRELLPRLGNDWLKDSVSINGIFNQSSTQETQKAIQKEYLSLQKEGSYSHDKLLSVLSFGIWKYMFSKPQFSATQKCLLAIFPYRPKSSIFVQYNHNYIYKELDNINKLRNRVAHNEPICFDKSKNAISTTYVREKYAQVTKLLTWMGIDPADLLYGLDHVLTICDKIDRLK